VSVGLPDTRPLNARPNDDSGGSEARLVIVCPDRAGIVASVAGFLRDAGANITGSDQHSTNPNFEPNAITASSWSTGHWRRQRGLMPQQLIANYKGGPRRATQCSSANR
jgi:hypothetical protein